MMSKILIDEATVKLALEALEAENQDERSEFVFEYRKEVIATLREALAEQPAAVQQKMTHQQARQLINELAEQPAQQEPVAWMELLREARDNCKASIVEEGISASRKEYRIDLEARLIAALNTSPPAQRKPLTDEQINLLINGRGDEEDDDYVEPTGDGFGLTDADLVRLIRRVEAAHKIEEKNNG